MSKTLFILVVAALAGCASNQNMNNGDQQGMAAFNADSLARHIAVMSADDFLGRKPFTEGETKTIAYLQQQFAAAGLEPANGSSYLQEVPMVSISTTASPEMHVQSASGSFRLKGFDDYVIWTNKTDPAVSLQNAELVFAGYGVVAPEYNWNDYAGIDVKGKVVLVLVNDPGFGTGDTSLFKGKAMTYYGRWSYKFEEAARQGASGCLIVHNTAAASYPFSVVQNNWNGSRLRLDPRGKQENNCDIIGWVSENAAQRLLAAAGKDASLFRMANVRGARPVPMGLKLSASIGVKATYNKSYNVLGKVTGSKRPDEVIIYTAHWDHLGIGKPDNKGDSIYNGALDNASGTAALIQLAKAFKQMKTRPERSVVFLAVTAEEQGLWGSAYYAQNPIYPIRETVANINMDGLPIANATDIIVVGRGQNDLEDFLKQEADAAGRVVAYENQPEAGYYYRSDHFNFARAGVPALYTKRGVDVVGKGRAAGEAMETEYRDKHYHRPSDEYIQGQWDLTGAINDLKLLFAVGRRLAYSNTWPGWKEGSEFKAIREQAK